MESNGSGGYINERMAEVEAMMKIVAADHILIQQGHREFQQEHQLLLKAQVVMQDTLQQLAVSQKNTGDKLDALISVVDGLIRANSKPTA